MKSWPTAALAALALVAAPALAGPASNVPAEQHRISLNTHGSLREAVKHIADDAKLSVVVRGGGEINEAGDFHFENVPAREALDTLAAAYGLILEQHGSVYTLRPPTGPENAERLMARLRRPGNPPPGPAMAPLPPLPPVPPVPPVPPGVVSKDSDSDEEDMDTDSADEDQQEQAEERRAQTEERRAQAEERRTELRERLREMKDKLKLRGLPHHSGNDCDVSVTGNYTVEEGQEACD